MEDMNNMESKENLTDWIEESFGFKKELIENPELCGLWHVRFTVGSICYYGYVPYHGALPQLKVVGDTYKHHWKGTPVTEEYYEEFVKNEPIKLMRCVDLEAGDWKYTGKEFQTEEEAIEYIGCMSEADQTEYDYDIL